MKCCWVAALKSRSSTIRKTTCRGPAKMAGVVLTAVVFTRASVVTSCNSVVTSCNSVVTSCVVTVKKVNSETFV